MFSFITEPIRFLLEFLLQTTGNLGVAIILLTLIIRAALVPLTYPGQKKMHENRKKMNGLKPQLKKLKEKFKNDKTKFAQAQMELYKANGIQIFSLSSLLPLSQLIFLIALYSVLNTFIHNGSALGDAVYFLGFNLIEKDKTYILPVLSVVTQLAMSVMILPGVEKHDIVPDQKKSKNIKKLNEKEANEQDQAEAINQQMIIIMPFMTGLFALNFPSGIVLYWIAMTVASSVQQYAVSGWGGFEKLWNQYVSPRLKA